MKLTNSYTLEGMEIAEAFLVNDNYHQTKLVHKCDVKTSLTKKHVVITINVPIENAEEMIEEYVMNEMGDESTHYAVALLTDAQTKELTATVVGKNKV